MKILIVHGYLLSGTGSNLYVQNLARAFCDLGNDVLLCCQDHSASDYDFVNQVVTFSNDGDVMESVWKQTKYNGSCKVYLPKIGKYLPVYVEDDYEKFEAKDVVKWGKNNIEDYIGKNVSAIRYILNEDKPDVVISNHLILQPICVSRAVQGSIKHFIIVHGSAFNFSVRKSDYLKKLAIESIKASNGMIFLTTSSEKDFLRYFREFKGEINTEIISGGVDLNLFKPLKEENEKMYFIENYIQNGDGKNALDSLKNKIDWKNDNTIMYYGKYLWTKGMQYLILTQPIVNKFHPDAKLILVGFGSAKNYMEKLIDAMNQGDEKYLIELIDNPQKYQDNVEETTLYTLKGFRKLISNDEWRKSYIGLCKGNIKNQILLLDFLPHEKLAPILSCADIAIAPSIYPEAFGLVGIEALASGILPIQADHSGFSSVIDVYQSAYESRTELKAVKRLKLSEDFVMDLLDKILIVLDAYEQSDEKWRFELKSELRTICEENFSWSQTAQNIISLYQRLN